MGSARDGVTVWLDTRDARTSHRASRYCHQFHFLPTGGGPQHDEPAFAQVKIHRALHDAPLAPGGAVPFRCTQQKSGYVLEAFLPAAVLNGFDPEQNPRLGFWYVVREFTALPLAIWLLWLLVEIRRAHHGAAEYYPPRSTAFVVFSVVVLLFALYHSVTFLSLSGLIIRIKLFDRTVPSRAVSMAMFGLWALASVVVGFVLIWFAR